MDRRTQVLILCTGNSARSQMAEGILRHDGGNFFDVESAGVEPSRVRPEAIQAMTEIGIDISNARNQSTSLTGKRSTMSSQCATTPANDVPSSLAERSASTATFRTRCHPASATKNRVCKSFVVCATKHASG